MRASESAISMMPCAPDLHALVDVPSIAEAGVKGYEVLNVKPIKRACRVVA